MKCACGLNYNVGTTEFLDWRVMCHLRREFLLWVKHIRVFCVKWQMWILFTAMKFCLKLLEGNLLFKTTMSIPQKKFRVDRHETFLYKPRLTHTKFNGSCDAHCPWRSPHGMKNSCGTSTSNHHVLGPLDDLLQEKQI